MKDWGGLLGRILYGVLATALPAAHGLGQGWRQVRPGLTGPVRHRLGKDIAWYCLAVWRVWLWNYMLGRVNSFCRGENRLVRASIDIPSNGSVEGNGEK